ncbi:MAG: anthranilate synthase component I family protein [Brumimicrobium sp.]
MDEVIVFLNNNSSKKLLAFGVEEFVEIKSGDGLDKCIDFIERNNDTYRFGFMSYDIKNEIEKLTSANQDRIKFPLLYFFKPKTVVEVDLKGNFTYLQGRSSIENDKFILDFLAEEGLLAKNEIQLHSVLSKQDYIDQVNKLKEHIQLGDIYEVTYCQEFYNKSALINPVSTYFRLNEKTNAPFSCYFKLNDKHLISGSPERFLKKEGNKLTSQPIKGTARRSKDPQHDEEIKKELSENPKENSENIMIVDLVRNDLSKIAEKNSVIVEELCGVYTFKTVHQLISTISATISPAVKFDEIMRALFPMGSMTGAPKVRAMKLIEEYETFKRGLFSGTVGYLKPNGDFDFNVVIRSILYNETSKQLSCPVGGAITIQSDPEMEYEECLLKMEAMKTVLNE